MARKSTAKLLFLFEDEVRAAASALEDFVETNSVPEESRDKEEWGDKLTAALQCCQTALFGAGDKTLSLILCKKDIFESAKRGGKGGVQP